MNSRRDVSRSMRRAAGRGLTLVLAFAWCPAAAAASGAAPTATATPAGKGTSAKSAGAAALPAVVREACDGAASLLKSWPGTNVDRPEGPVEDPKSEKKRPGCRVHARGSFAALKDAPLPDVQLGTWFQKQGWQENPEYDADGPDGTEFAYETSKAVCFVRLSWDGGDDSDPDYVPEDWFEVDLGCVAKSPAPAEKK